MKSGLKTILTDCLYNFYPESFFYCDPCSQRISLSNLLRQLSHAGKPLGTRHSRSNNRNNAALKMALEKSLYFVFSWGWHTTTKNRFYIKDNPL